MQIGNPVIVDKRSDPSSSAFIVKWETKEDQLALELNGREKRALSIRAGNGLRLEFELRQIIELRIGENDTGNRTILFHFRYPPYCFRPQEKKNTGISNTMRALMCEWGIYDDAYFWSSTTRDNNEGWIRTIDPTGGSTLSRYRSYRIIFSHATHSQEDKILLEHFRDFSMKSTPDLTPSIASNDWCGGFVKEQSGLHFSTRYLLHTLLSNSWLILPTAEESRRLGHNL